MKKIIKSTSPSFFETWKSDFTHKHKKEPKYADNFVGDVKRLFKGELLKEQGYICCYCMAYVDCEQSHIEHFEPQSKSNRDLDYFNMFVSCNGYKNDHSHCGHKVASWYDKDISLSPLDQNIEVFFEYLADGTIIGTCDKATTNIEKLGLNNFALKKARGSAISASGVLDADITQDKINNLISTYSSRDKVGAFIPFCQTIIYCLLHSI